MRLLECVPNVSEGRDATVVERIVRAVEETPGVELLDWSADRDHNRAVLTYVGEPEAVLAGTRALCLEAFAAIDMQQHEGAHPRLGAVDVIPFVPLRGVTSEEAVVLARELGEWIGQQGVPVYYYQEAATRPERQSLPDVRRGEYEGLAARLATPEGAPDAGPAVFNARSGASIVGVRPPLIAFNVNLRTDELAIAIKIANAIRESSGGLPAVQAMGVMLENPGMPPMAQVSMNLVDWERTGIAEVVREIRRMAREAGTQVDHCELIGLAPTGALLEVAADALGLRDFSPDQALELRLAKDR